MGTLAVQYLENGPKIRSITASEAQARLRFALDRLPISMLLLGWNLPDALVDACVEECKRAGVQLYRWHPLLAGDGSFVPKPAWQTIGLDGEPIPGFQGKPEFTFVCPNRPAVREAALSHLRDVLQDGRYQGVFLDRIRYPSPASRPEGALGCFCEDCQRAAAKGGLDLEAVRWRITGLVATPEGAKQFVGAVLDPGGVTVPSPDLESLVAFVGFRAQSVSRFVQAAAEIAHDMGRAVGLDCFSPALTSMVGQALGTLTAYSEWIKIMSYGHVLGPAGIPYELLGLADWLIEEKRVSEAEALAWLSGATRLPLPQDRAALREHGLSPEALKMEVQRARDAGVSTLLAGIELVEMPGIIHLDRAQITEDLVAFRAAGADGLVLSWDLWKIPSERLEIVRAAW